MDISELTIRLIVLLLPGAIASLIVERLTVHPKWSPFQFIIYSVILGMFSYLLYQVTLYTIGIPEFFYSKKYSPKIVTFWQSLFDSKQPISQKEVLYTCIHSLIAGLLVSNFIHYKYLNKIAKKLKISDKYGDENLFTFFLNTNEVNWIWIRDPKKGLTYEGLRESFSETDNIREIVLREVRVYNYDDSELLYEIPALYLSFPIGELHIEMPPSNNKEVQDGTKRNETKATN